jgi:hypothetical protein
MAGKRENHGSKGNGGDDSKENLIRKGKQRRDRHAKIKTNNL